MFNDLVLLLGDFGRLQLDFRAEGLDLLVFGSDHVLICLQFGLELNDQFSTLLESSLIPAAFFVLTILHRPHLCDFHLFLFKLLGDLV